MSDKHLSPQNSNDLMPLIFSAAWLPLLDHDDWHGTCAVGVELCTDMRDAPMLLCL